MPSNAERRLSVDEATRVQLIAYEKWSAAGRPHGDALCFWLDAKREWMLANPIDASDVRSPPVDA